MYSVVSVAVLVAACLVQPLRAEVLNNGDVFQVYPALEDAPEGTTPLYFALMQSFSGGYVSAGGIPGLMVALDEINNNSDVLPGYSLHYTLSDNGVCNLASYTRKRCNCACNRCAVWGQCKCWCKPMLAGPVNTFDY